MNHYNDIEEVNKLVRSYRTEGSLDVLGELYKPFMHLVYGLCLKYLKDPGQAQDAQMEIFEILIEKLKSYEVEHFKSWLYMVSKNHCLMKLRKEKSSQQRVEKFSQDQNMESSYVMHLQEERPLEIDSTERLNLCIEKLKQEQRSCIQLFYLEKKSYQEVMELTSYDIKKVKSHIQNGKRNLKNCLEQSE